MTEGVHKLLGVGLGVFFGVRTILVFRPNAPGDFSVGVQVYSFRQKPNVKIPVRPGKRPQLIVAGHLEDQRFIINCEKSPSL